MAMTYNRVLRAEYGDGDQVYTIVLDSGGMYFLRTGNIGGLLNESTDTNLNEVVLDENTQKFVEELVTNEERIKTLPLAPLAAEPHSAYVPFAELSAVSASAELDEPTMYLRTLQGDFSFVFTYTTGEQVEELGRLLEAEIEKHHPDDREA